MSKVLNILLSVAVVVLLLLLNMGRPTVGTVEVSQSFLDSLTAVASRPPDTVTIEKIVKGDKVVVYRTEFVPVYTDTTTNTVFYADSLVNDSIDVRVDIGVKGTLESLKWAYKPVYKETTKEITVTKPYPVPYYINKKVGGVLVGAELGYCNAAMVGAELGYIDKKGWQYSGGFGYIGEKRYFKVGLGFIF